MSVYLSVGEGSSSWETVNTVLQAAGLPQHLEPSEPCDGAAWSCEIGGMGCFVHLQRVAAYVALGQDLPEPTLDFEKVWKDPIRRRYYRTFKVERPRRGLWRSVCPAARRRDLSASSLGRVQSPFAHLMYHEAEYGYFLP
jgi:hypothetical protein